MPPVLAVISTLLLIAFLFYWDYKDGRSPSPALAIPCIWIFIRGSRSLTEWFNLGTPPTGIDIVDGTPLDAAVTFLLMGIGFAILLRRRVSWVVLFRENWALVLFLFYCAISITWSDFPFVSFKRWFKYFADPIMVLIVLTDRDPLRAVETVSRTMVNLLVPLSILFIRYFPDLGRAYDDWTGTAVYTGVTTNKNLLGFVLMVCGLSLVWRLYKGWVTENRNKLDSVIPLLLLGMVGWLFNMANSKTSLICFLIGVTFFFVLGLSGIRKNLLVYITIGMVAFIVLQTTVNLTGLIITSAGREETLTGRTELWAVLLSMQQHPILGFGFESFWLGARRQMLQEMWYFAPNQAHSGYIELYLNLGWVGCLFLGGVILSCYSKLSKLLTIGSHKDDWVVFGRLGMAYLLIYLLYNYTEAAFKSPHLLFVFFLLFAMTDMSKRVAVKTLPAALPNKAQVMGLSSVPVLR
ncbi:MAG: O-antigen ligase family protein [Nitrospira sp.]